VEEVILAFLKHIGGRGARARGGYRGGRSGEGIYIDLILLERSSEQPAETKPETAPEQKIAA